MEGPLERLRLCWRALYGHKGFDDLFESFLHELRDCKERIEVRRESEGMNDLFWFKDAVVYSLYVDLFNKDFHGLTEKLDYIADLGVTCLWLLPILDSPMRDQGYDVRDYRRIRSELLGLPVGEDSDIFESFISQAHSRGIRVMFDVPINHTSEEHEWFQRSLLDPADDFYIWTHDQTDMADARVIFKGLCTSNWELASPSQITVKQPDTEGFNPPASFYLHRFFPHQPDLNYKNQVVLIEMCRVFVHWIERGMDGFRLDAVPYLWKEEGTNSENLSHTHIIVKFMRAVVDFVRPGTLLLAEACQPPNEVVKYFGDASTGEECQAAYHFPLMPRLYRALAEQSAEPVITTMDKSFTPAIPPNAQWFTFLRCHDELTLEMVSHEERASLFAHYCKESHWSFREGEGISARLADLLDRDPKRIALAFSLLLSLVGTPVVFYGDEFGKSNDEEFYREMLDLTGIPDSRYYVRGRVDWAQTEENLKKPETLAAQIYHDLKAKIAARSKFLCFGRGHLELITEVEEVSSMGTFESSTKAMVYTRSFVDTERVVCINNLSSDEKLFKIPVGNLAAETVDLLSQKVGVIESSDSHSILRLAPFQHHWINMTC